MCVFKFSHLIISKKIGWFWKNWNNHWDYGSTRHRNFLNIIFSHFCLSRQCVQFSHGVKMFEVNICDSNHRALWPSRPPRYLFLCSPPSRSSPDVDLSLFVAFHLVSILLFKQSADFRFKKENLNLFSLSLINCALFKQDFGEAVQVRMLVHGTLRLFHGQLLCFLKKCFSLFTSSFWSRNVVKLNAHRKLCFNQ